MVKLSISKNHRQLRLVTGISERDKAKSIPHGLWDFRQQCWVFAPTTENFYNIRKALKDIINIDTEVDKWVFEENRRQILFRKYKQALRLTLINPCCLPGKPYNHQIAGIRCIEIARKILLSDEMGLGKSYQALVAFWSARQLPGVSRCLIVCPKSLKYNWADEIKKHLGAADSMIKIIEGSKAKRQKLMGDKTDEKFNDIFWITSYDTLRVHDRDKQFKEFAQNQYLILDECQYVKNARSKRSKASTDLEAEYKVLLTGTPIANHPEDLFSLIQIVKPMWNNWWQFEDNYIIRNKFGGIYGYRNLDDLKKKLDSISLRRLKSQVFDLPEKVYENRVLDMTKIQSEKYKICFEEMRLAFDDCGEKDFGKKYLTLLTMLIRLNQISDGFISDGKKIQFIPDAGKFIELDSIVNDYQEKIVVWCSFVPLVKYLHEKYKDISVPFYGDMNEKQRKEALDKFKTDDKCRLFFGQVATGGLGINLVESQMEIFFDIPHSPMLLLQATDRLHRIGQKGTVNVIYFLSKDSIDIKMLKSIKKKTEVINQLTGDEDRTNYKDMKELLADV